jgi:hypothetical protein
LPGFSPGRFGPHRRQAGAQLPGFSPGRFGPHRHQALAQSG